jgi:hypothetical protein
MKDTFGNPLEVIGVVATFALLLAGAIGMALAFL